jgi:hypothetical protein
MTNRQTPRVILRRPRRGSFEDNEVLVIEMGLGGAKFEHSVRLDVGHAGLFACGPLTTQAVVRHSVLLPTETGIVYQSGVSFTQLGEAEQELLLDLLVSEAKEQVVEWELNFAGEPQKPARGPAGRSAVAPRYISLKLLTSGWQRSVTADPNQPIDGVTIVDTTPEEEVVMLQEMYKAADQATRELLRRTATVAILEGLRG